MLDKPEPTKSEIAELVGRVSQYLALSHSSNLSIAEAMVTYKEKLTDEEVDEMIREADIDGDGQINYDGKVWKNIKPRQFRSQSCEHA